MRANRSDPVRYCSALHVDSNEVPPTPDSTNETEEDWIEVAPTAPAADVDSCGVPLLSNTGANQ